MESLLLFIGGGSVFGTVVGHAFASMFDIRSKANPGVPDGRVAIVIGIIGAVMGGVAEFVYNNPT